MNDLIASHDPVPDCECRDCANHHCNRLRTALDSVLASEIGRQTLLKLAEGHGLGTSEGEVWLNAKAILAECSQT